MSAKFDALYDNYVSMFGESACLTYGVKICKLFTNLNNILVIDALDNGVVFTFRAENNIDDNGGRYILNIYIEENGDKITHDFELIEISEIKRK